jgi:hypothetical protein
MLKLENFAEIMPKSLKKSKPHGPTSSHARKDDKGKNQKGNLINTRGHHRNT